MKEQDTITWMADFYEKKFMKLSSCFFQYIVMEVNIAQVFSFRTLEYNETSHSVFTSNLIFTLNDFHNVLYCDENYSFYSYGI